MDTGGALLKAIIANKADDTPRMVYADWLDERGEPGDADRAEFIRLSIERRNLQSLGMTDLCHRADYSRPILRPGEPYWHCKPECPLCRFLDIEQRHRQLLNVMVAATDRISGIFVVPEWFSRGFISTIAQPWKEWWNNYQSILQQHPIEKVRFSTIPYTLAMGTSGNRLVKLNLPWAYAGYQFLDEHALETQVKSLLADIWPGIIFSWPSFDDSIELEIVGDRTIWRSSPVPGDTGAEQCQR